jgi:mycothiol synthase
MRQATPDDADAIYAVVNARELADVGRPDWTPADARAALAKPGVDGVVVTAGAGDVIAFGLLNGIDATVVVHPRAEGEGIGTRLREEIERRASGPLIRQEIMSANERGLGLLTAAGYGQEQRYWRMDRELAPDEAGNTGRTFEEWRDRALSDALAPELSTVAGDMAGVALCQRHPGAEGYVDYVAVARDWRGRGLGRALLQESFRRFAAEDMSRAVLWVNGANESATRLYRGVGMEVAFSADRFTKCLKPR